MVTSFSDLPLRISPEVERLLNPVFCACIIARFANAYGSSNNNATGLTYPLIFLCLPLTLHPSTRNEINKHNRTYGFHRLVRENPNLLVRFAERVEGFATVSREALALGIRYNLFDYDVQNGVIIPEDKFIRRITRSLLGEEAFQPIRAAELIGYWFAQMNVAEVFLHLGIQP